nr:small acid-soluble spore protein Tlp [Niallia sp.]
MSFQKPNPDDRSDNVEKLQDMVQNTSENIDKAEETLMNASAGEKEMIQQKNQRREAAIQSFKEEIQDEASDRENGYQ